MKRLSGALCILLLGASLAQAEMDASTRRDFIVACMFSGGLEVSGQEPPISERNGRVDVERTVKSWVDAFERPEDKLAAGKEMTACLQQVLDAGDFKRQQSRVVPRDAIAVELVQTVEPKAYAEGILCKRPDIRQQLQLSRQLRAMGAGVDPKLKRQMDQMMGAALGVDMDDPLTRALLDVDPDAIDCSVDRICDIRGSVPVEVLSGTMSIFDIPMRQVEVQAGNCQGRKGFVNERFMEF